MLDAGGRHIVRGALWLAEALAPWALFVAVWYAVSYSGLVSQALMPPPHVVARVGWRSLMSGELPVNMAVSAYRVVVGVLLGVGVALPVGFVLGWYRPVRRFVSPLMNFLRALPPIALIPLVIIYFGIGELSKIVVLFYSSFFASVIVIYEGIAQLSPIYVRVSRTLGASEAEIFTKVIAPLCVPHIFTALRVALGVGWATLVASELIAARFGLGAMMQEAASFFRIDVIYLGIICIGMIALAMDTLIRWAAAVFLVWQDKIVV